jgi:hypothetical protein
LRQRIARGGLGRCAHLDSHGSQVGDGLDQHEVALVGHGLDRERGQDSIADAQECSARIHHRIDELAVSQFAEAVGVDDHGDLRGDRLLVAAIQDDQGLAGGRAGELSVRAQGALKAARGGKSKKTSSQQKCAQTIHA